MMFSPGSLPVIAAAALFVSAMMPAAPSAAQCQLDRSNYRLVFEENFDTLHSAEELRPRWVFQPSDTGWSWGNAGNAVRGATLLQQLDSGEHYRAEQVSIFRENGNGYLRLSADRYATPRIVHVQTPAPGAPDGFDRRALYRSGMIRLRPDLLTSPFEGCRNAGTREPWSGFIYGMFEIRMKIPRGNTFPAFWLAGPSQLNVYEGKFGEREFGVGFSRFWNEDPGRYNWRQKVHGKDLADTFHVYTAVWTPDKIAFFFDGRETATFTGEDVRTLAGNPPWCEANALLVTLQMPKWSDVQHADLDVDYIRVYKPVQGNYALRFKEAAGFIHSSRLERGPDPLPAPTGVLPALRNASITPVSGQPGAAAFVNSDGGITLRTVRAGSSAPDYTILRDESGQFIRGAHHLTFLNGPDPIIFLDDSGRIMHARRNAEPFTVAVRSLLPETDIPIPRAKLSGQRPLCATRHNDIFYTGQDDRVHHLSMRSGSWVHQPLLHPFTISSEVQGDLCTDSAGTCVFYRGKDGLVQLFRRTDAGVFRHGYADSTDSADLFRVNTHSRSLACSAAGTVVFAGEDGRLHAYETGSAGRIHQLLRIIPESTDTAYPEHARFAGGLTLSADGRSVFYVGKDGRMQGFVSGKSDPSVWRHLAVDPEYDSPLYLSDILSGDPSAAADDDPDHPTVWYRDYRGNLSYFQWRDCEFPDQPDGSWNTIPAVAERVK